MIISKCAWCGGLYNNSSLRLTAEQMDALYAVQVANQDGKESHGICPECSDRVERGMPNEGVCKVVNEVMAP